MHLMQFGDLMAASMENVHAWKSTQLIQVRIPIIAA